MLTPAVGLAKEDEPLEQRTSIARGGGGTAHAGWHCILDGTSVTFGVATHQLGVVDIRTKYGTESVP